MDPNKPKDLETLWLREYRKEWLAELARQKEAGKAQGTLPEPVPTNE